MPTFNKSKFNEVLTAYKHAFPTKIGEEIYKWKAVKRFQDTWDIDAPDFKEMFLNATQLHINLLSSQNRFPRKMVGAMCDYEPETVRNMFRALFDETQPLDGRITAFMAESERIRQQYWPDRLHFQDYNSVSVYLWSMFPDKYYIYKYSEIKATAKELESDLAVKKGSPVTIVDSTFALFNSIRSSLVEDPEIRPMLNAVLTSDCWEDKSLNCVVGDIVFFISRYYHQDKPAPAPDPSRPVKYWMYAPGRQASEWDECKEKGLMLIGWDDLGDLSQYGDREDMRDEMISQYGDSTNYKNDSLSTWNFFDSVEVGDIVFARKGRKTILGRGVVESDYIYDPKREYYKNVRKVKWTETGDWSLDEMTDIKTLTEITQYKDYVKRLQILVTGGVVPEEQCQYFWLSGNPAIWSMSQWAVGEEQSYTLYNENKHQRKIFKNFLEAKAGDKIVCYETSPVKQITGLAIISHGNDGEQIWFEKKETLTSPIDLKTIEETPELADMEYMKNRQGSLFKLTKDEYDVILDIIRDSNANKESKPVFPKYTRKDFLNEVFMTESSLTSLEKLLINKKNIILQGAPGVGKTFAAERLAYEMMGEKDPTRVCMVQFHQNYSYEDFVLGYRPSGSEFELQRGTFYKFCIAAANNRNQDYFFIIDEINRGNLSKIFGELLMLIEKTYREKQISLAYNDEKFSVPSNIFILGMMNTADRSLAMIDYALRRRFSFFEMKPGFDSEGFIDYKNKLASPRFNKLIDVVKSLNEEIAHDASLGSGFEIGHSYFCEQKSAPDEWLHQVIDYDLVPMLKEYWFDNKDKVNEWELKLNSIFND